MSEIIKIYEFFGNSSMVFNNKFNEFKLKSSIVLITAILTFEIENVL